MRTARLAGHYFNVLGIGQILGMIIYPLLGESFRLDCSFLIHFWIAWGLLSGRSGYRKVVIVLSSMMVLICIGYLIHVAWTKDPVLGAEGALRTPALAAIVASILLIIFLIPLVLLLLPATRAWFAERRMTPAERSPLTIGVIGGYVAAVSSLFGVGFTLERLPHTAQPDSRSGAFQYGDRQMGVAAAQWMEDKASGRPLYVSWLAFAEANSWGASSEYDGKFKFGNHSIEVPPLKRVRYLGDPPTDDESRANVMIVHKDGNVTRLARRVRPDQLEAAFDVTDGVRDFDEIQRRLEALLPAPDVAAR